MAPCQEHSGFIARIESLELGQERILIEMQKMNSTLNSIWNGEGNQPGMKERINSLEAFSKKAKYFAWGATTVFLLNGTPEILNVVGSILKAVIL